MYRKLSRQKTTPNQADLQEHFSALDITQADIPRAMWPLAPELNADTATAAWLVEMPTIPRSSLIPQEYFLPLVQGLMFREAGFSGGPYDVLLPPDSHAAGSPQGYPSSHADRQARGSL